MLPCKLALLYFEIDQNNKTAWWGEYSISNPEDKRMLLISPTLIWDGMIGGPIITTGSQASVLKRDTVTLSVITGAYSGDAIIEHPEWASHSTHLTHFARRTLIGLWSFGHSLAPRLTLALVMFSNALASNLKAEQGPAQS